MKHIKLKVDDIVIVPSSQIIGKITDIQYAFDRYQLSGVSGWQYGVDELVKQTDDNLIELVQALRREINSHGPEGRNYTNAQYVELLLESEQLQKEIIILREQNILADAILKLSREATTFDLAMQALRESKRCVDLAIFGNLEHADTFRSSLSTLIESALEQIDKIEKQTTIVK
jgi:hypothetical protein